MRGWEEMASERYPLLSTASQLFFRFVFRVLLSSFANHYVNAMRRIMKDEIKNNSKVESEFMIRPVTQRSDGVSHDSFQVN